MLELLIVVPVVTVLALLCLERRLLRRFAADDHVFACRVRALSTPPAAWPWLRRRWSRIMRACWDGPVLVVRRGPVPWRTVRLPAQVSSPIYLVAEGERGMRPVAVRVVAGGVEIEVSAMELSRVDLVGPYLVAATSSLPAPARRREI